MHNTNITCDHTGTWNSHPPVPFQLKDGILPITVMWCESCGHVEYRSPPLNKQDEDGLHARVREFKRSEEIVTPKRINQ